MERVAATRSIFVVLVLVVVSSLFVLSLARRTIDQLPGDAEGSASSLQTLASPNLLLLPRAQSDQDPHKRTNLEAAKPLPAAAAAAEEEAAALAVPDRRPPDADLESSLPAAEEKEEIAVAAAEEEEEIAVAAAEEEEENAVAGAEADRSSAEVMGWIPKDKEGERAKKKTKKKRGKKTYDSDADSDSDSDDEEEEDEGEAKKKKMKKKKGKGGFLRWFWRLVNRF